MPTAIPRVDEGSVFSRTFDVVVCGSGYAGFAAAHRLSSEGRRVLLTSLRPDLLWESGRTFQNDTGPWTPAFRPLSDNILRITAIADEWFDGAVAEQVATELLRDARVPMLYYAAPIAVEREGEDLAAVIVATKGGLRRIVAKQWIDATESGTIARLLSPSLQPRTPVSQTAAVMLQRVRWPDAETATLTVPELPGCRVTWMPSRWANERALRIEMPGNEPRFLPVVVPALKALRARLGSAFDDAFVSHVSFEPYPAYGGTCAAASPAANLALASPVFAPGAIRTLVDRFELGLAAVAELADRPACEAGARLRRAPVNLPSTMRVTEAEVAVAGLGAGGALAAVAAGREGVATFAFESLAFAGGVATGGGIPGYHYGCPGGLFEEADGRVRDLMPLFASRDTWPRGFHPDVKRIVLEDMLDAAGVRRVYGALLGQVERTGQRVDAVVAATPEGPLRIRSRTWIDATGDGDLCALAGSRFRLGRTGDGSIHAYTQSCGCFGCDRGRLVNFTTNPDTGHVDPTDAEDMTRARIEGVHAFMSQVVNATNRLTYLAPLLGLRQGRFIAADYQLTLDDLVEGRRFDDAVGYTGSHYDNHSRDYEFESDAARFYVWAAGQWGARTACEMPYRMLLPRGLANVWLGCRAAGLTDEAAQSCRMQRDLQRLGEVCGLAAALAVRNGTESRGVSLDGLRSRLRDSGALELPKGLTDFGRAVLADAFAGGEGGTAEENAQRWLVALGQPDAGAALWRLYRLGPSTAPQLRGYLRSRDQLLKWRAALLLAAWGDAAAESCLLPVVAKLDPGPEPQTGMAVPRWRLALSLLRNCGTARSVPVLGRLARRPDLPAAAQIGIALACEALAAPGRLRAGERKRLQQVVERLSCQSKSPVDKDVPWQRDYAVARARAALRMPFDALSAAYRNDPRAIVRHAFARIGRRQKPGRGAARKA